jgi:hypothetical protein
MGVLINDVSEMTSTIWDERCVEFVMSKLSYKYKI